MEIGGAFAEYGIAWNVRELHWNEIIDMSCLSGQQQSRLLARNRHSSRGQQGISLAFDKSRSRSLSGPMTRKQGPIRSANNNDRLELDPALARVGLESLRDSCSSLVSLLQHGNALPPSSCLLRVCRAMEIGISRAREGLVRRTCYNPSRAPYMYLNSRPHGYFINRRHGRSL